jgi:hypothetical protein
MSTRLLRLNNKFKEVGTNGDFSIVIPVTDLDNVAKITLLSASIPRLFGNVYKGISIMRWYQASVPPQILEVVIPDGQYTATELAVILTNLLPLTVTYVDNHFVFQNTGSDAINILPGNDTLSQYIGITEGLLVAVGVTLVAPSIPQLSGPLAVYIQSNAIANNSCLDVLTNGLALPVVVPINISSVPYGFDIGWEAPTGDEWQLKYTQFPDGQTLRDLDIRICDCYGNVLSFPDNAYSDLVFKISYSAKDTSDNYSLY